MKTHLFSCGNNKSAVKFVFTLPSCLRLAARKCPISHLKIINQDNQNTAQMATVNTEASVKKASSNKDLLQDVFFLNLKIFYFYNQLL